MISIDDFYARVGKRICDVRKKRKMTQEDLGTAVKLTRTSIINIEKGRQKLLLHTFAGIAETLSIDIAELFPQQNKTVTERLDDVLDQRPEPVQDFVRNAVRSATVRKAKS